ncbi:neurogenic locus Notch protein-like [Ruditapes philippinarum]|uniref:neurogenic locus Notch protein-like n=1 Tax=Ruditapes philippinarum TaxID=129788 RepID=UPI00295B6143|nr:neurogenic locus Notch protein-like [Ruditapes philippinarum]
MEIRILMLMTVITVCVIPKASTLTCLQCNNVPQPRHCNAVTECDKDETCGIEEISNEFGEKLFNVGCMKRMKCQGANSTQHCIQCCSTDVCNHEGCGEIGYPRHRGPICYYCPVHTQSKACHFVDICRAGEVCKFDSRREFDDMLFSSGCSDAHACKQGAPLQPSIVGRDIDDNKYRAIRKQHRSLIEHVCRSCCESDLCNNMCNGSISAATSQCVSNPCHHGQCYDVSNGFVCVCNHGYEGRQCDKLILPCASNPCMRGNCTNNNDRYTCQCPQDYRGTKCEFKILPCELNPCMRGNCTNENNGYTCQCPQYYTGRNCETKILPCESNPCMRGNCTNKNDGYTCQCPQDYTGTNCETRLLSDCYDLLNIDHANVSGVYYIKLWQSHTTIQVYCDMDTDGGGWTVFQRRFNGSVDFYKSFYEYENGFGSLDGEFWLGLAYVQEMASQGQSELRLDLKAADDSTAYETYQNFKSRSLANLYPSYRSRRWNSSSYSCAKTDHGGWWYNGCTLANLNGEYVTPGTISSYHSGEGGVIYREFQEYKSLKETKMMFRRV